MNTNKSIGIIGGGFVGQILKQYYPEALVYDKDEARSEGTLGDVLKRKYIFLAINLPDNAATNASIYELSSLFEKLEGEHFIIIKSTFVPGTCDLLQNFFSHLRFVYNPEFLTERTAWEDFTKPQFQILGAPYQSLPFVQEIFELLPPAESYHVVSPLDAEILKHAINSYYATKVIFFNQLYDSCFKLGGDYETIRNIMIQNPWIGNSHSEIYHKGYRGFGGKCLPKDIRTFQLVGESELLKKVIEILR